MTKSEIMAVIEDRLNAVEHSCNSTHTAHTDGVLRGLIWAYTGKDPGYHLLGRIIDIYKLMDVPTRLMGDHFHYSLKTTESDIEKELNQKCEYCKPERTS